MRWYPDAMTVTLIVLDSVGVGALPDARAFGDAGADTIDHVAAATGVQLPNFARLGLGNIPGVTRVPTVVPATGSWGRLAERSPGKDTTTGHWEFMGVVLDRAFKTYSRFPKEVMAAFDEVTGRSHLGNKPASGTAIIMDLGPKHLETGAPIVYTSADSVFQIAAHVDVVPLDTLYRWCEGARAILQGEHAVARVIARPFTGRPGAFRRLSGKRRDYSLSPPHPTVLNALADAGKEVVGVGKIPDIYNRSGITREVKSGTNAEGIDATVEIMHERPDGLVFTNLVDFDSLYGHRRDTRGYAQALAAADERIPELMAATGDGDVLLFVSDHGNDPTWYGTDHTREYGLLLAYAPGVRPQDLGTRESFADVGATVAELHGVAWAGAGQSFAAALRD